MDNQWLASVEHEEILSIIKAINLLEIASHTRHVSASNAVQRMAENFLCLAIALVQKLQRSLLGVGKNWQQGVNLLIVTAIRYEVSFS